MNNMYQYPYIEQFYEDNYDRLLDWNSPIRPSKSCPKNGAAGVAKFVEFYQKTKVLSFTEDDVHAILDDGTIADGDTIFHQNLRVVRELNFVQASSTDGNKYVFTDEFLSFVESNHTVDCYIIEKLMSIACVEDLTMYFNFLICVMREAAIYGQVIQYRDAAAKFLMDVPDDELRKKHQDRIFRVYGFKGDQARGVTDNYTPNISYFCHAVLRQLGILAKSEERIDNMGTLVLTPLGEMILKKIDENLQYGKQPQVAKNKIRQTLNMRNLSLQQIFYGAPGTGKSFHVDGKTTDENSIRTTFHPDSDYASFVGAYKPIMAEMPMKVVPVVLNNGASFNQNEGTYSEKRISYKFVPQAFLKAYCNAWKNLGEPYYLVIEEINRGNCAQVFGDLFQLLDRNDQGYSSYAIEADEDIRRFISEDGEEYKLSSLQIEDVWNDDHSKLIAKGEDIANGAKLVLPKNLYIWATMNTSDQSLFPIDSAFKRRWDWEYIPIKYGKSEWKIDIDGVKYAWVDFQKEINKRIFDATESEDKQLGDYFVKADTNKIISAKLLLNKVIFYLWNDVCKDGDGDIFKINTDLDYSKELDHSKDEDITFSQFFQGNEDDKTLKLQQWMRYLGIKPIEGGDEEQEEETGSYDPSTKEVRFSKTEYRSILTRLKELWGEKSWYGMNGSGDHTNCQSLHLQVAGTNKNRSICVALDNFKNKQAEVKVWFEDSNDVEKLKNAGVHTFMDQFCKDNNYRFRDFTTTNKVHQGWGIVYPNFPFDDTEFCVDWIKKTMEKLKANIDANFI